MLEAGGKKDKNATVSAGFLPRIHPPAGGFHECSCSWLYLTVAGTGTADDGDLRSHPCGCHNVHCWWIHASSHSLCQEDTEIHRCQSGIMGVQRKMITADVLAKLPYWREPCHFSVSEGLRTEGHGWKITGVEVGKRNVYNCWKTGGRFEISHVKKDFHFQQLGI